ncbi:MAG TPA: hypothetical protein VFY99_10715 [Solirubrobacterales bacterium]
MSHAFVSFLPESGTPYFVLMLIGFVVGAWGHGMKSRFVVGLGIAMIFLATLLLPLAVVITNEEPPPPTRDLPSAGPE